MSTGRHFAVVTAAKADEYSLEDSVAGGLFTSRLMQALTASRGQQPLAPLFHEQVEQQVINASRA